jgi:lysophospholipase L1-like esterase
MLPARDVVLLGDSLTEWGSWGEWLPDLRIRNHGVAGETSADVLRRVGSAVEPAPALLYLLVGVNDLALGLARRRIVANVAAILDQVASRAPEAVVVVQSLLPCWRELRDDALTLNRSYRALVADRSPRCYYLDVWPALADQDGALAPDCTDDGVHLTAAGYAAWLSVLGPDIRRRLTDDGGGTGAAGRRGPQV